MTLALIVHCSAVIQTGSFGLFFASQDVMAHKNELDVGHVGNEGEHNAIFIMRLLTMGHNDSGATCSGGLSSSLEE